MAKLTWDAVGQRFFETGINNGVLYLPDAQGNYVNGVAWNGLTGVTESPSGAEANPQYADNIKYLNLFSAEEFTATVEAFTYPDEFAQFDGLGVPEPGITVGQQSRKTFGLSYKTVVGNDLEGNDFGYKLHLVYGCQASPSEKSYATINDSPEAITFSWSVTTTPVPVTGYKPTSIMTIESAKVDAAALAALELLLYGDTAVDPELPQPDSVIALFSGSVITITSINPPTQSGNNVTIPTTTGVTYYIDGEAVPAGVVAITTDTLVVANPNDGYVFAANLDDDWLMEYTP